MQPSYWSPDSNRENIGFEPTMYSNSTTPANYPRRDSNSQNLRPERSTYSISITRAYTAGEIRTPRFLVLSQLPMPIRLRRQMYLQKPDSNRHITPYEGAALPIGPFCNSSGYRSRTCYLRLMRPAVVFLSTHPQIGAAGIEPASSAYKTGALPLDEAPQTGTAGIEPAAFRLTAGRSAS